MSSGDRYKVVTGSESAHCCFKATVVDTDKPLIIDGNHYRDRYEIICECFSTEDANTVADALNKVNADE